jgi:hypothetical protein
MRKLSVIFAVTSVVLMSTMASAQPPAPTPLPAEPLAPECRRGALPATPGETTGSTDLGD